MESASIILNEEFDETLVTEICNMRLLRLLIAEKQRANIEDTICEMIGRGILPRNKINSARKSIAQELEEKIELLKQRCKNDRVVYIDEIEFFTNLMNRDQ